ncbi:MAG: 50S ribosomal protein L4 [Candidatus Thermoplasmatota archaeon]|nr:50S ribosomal protein L4 [Candidatus Thermoplasmatota archaeon]
MKAKVYGMDGKVVDEISLPSDFSEGFRPDIIRKAVNVMRANRRQPYGVEETAGKKHPMEPWSPGRGVSRVPRLTQGRRAVFMPGTVGGRVAHPPKPEKNWGKKINKKEMALARKSALSTLAIEEIVKKRGHVFEEGLSLPVVVENDFEKLDKTKNVIDTMKKIGVYTDVERAKKGRHIRAGKGKLRGRKYKIPKSLLIVVKDKEKIKKAAGNLIGVDIITPEEINVEHLAPGGDAGRLTVFTVDAIKSMEEKA